MLPEINSEFNLHSKGLFVAVEGSDGSGKATQIKLLAERLKAVGHEVEIFDFPRYDKTSSHFVKKYLNGEYGPASEISPYTASLFYALDRYEAAPLIRQSLSEGKIVLSNRYVGSNMAHQGSKFTNSGEQRGFFMWEDSLEFQLLGIPRPNINLFLRVPADVSYKLMEKRQSRSYTDKTHDEHEADINHLTQAVETYDNLCRLFPKEYKSIDCQTEGKLLSITEINELIWEQLKSFLPAPRHRGRSVVVDLKTDELHGQKAKSATTSELKDMSLLALSLLMPGKVLTLKYNWPSDARNRRLSHYIPSKLPPDLLKKYNDTMQKLANSYTLMQQKVTKNNKTDVIDYLDAVVPLAALADVKIDSHEETSLKNKPLMNSLPELRQFANRLSAAELSHPPIIKSLIKQLDESRSPLKANMYQTHLLYFWPRNELSLLIDSLQLLSGVDKDAVAFELEHWPYQRKAEALKAICIESNTSVANKLQYKFEIICDLTVLDSLMSALRIHNVEVQVPTPRYGYEVPSEIEEAGLDDSFIGCFDASLELYSALQAGGFDSLASYATLRGHRQKYQITTSGDGLFTSDVGGPENFKNLLQAMRDLVKEVHPIVADSLERKITTKKKPISVSNKKTPRSRRL